MRRWWALAFAGILGGCFFPSLDGLSGDGGADVTVSDAPSDHPTSDGGAEAGPCPPNSDPSLVVYYPFYEGSGLVVHDCSGHGYDGVIEGDAASPWTTSGHPGDAVVFASAHQTCVVVSSSNANQVGSLTAAAWFNLATPYGGYVVGQRHQTGYAWRIDIEPDDAGPILGFAVGIADDAGNDDYAIANTRINPGGWHHVAAVFTPGGAMQAIYLDRVQTLGSPAAVAIIADPIASTITIGCRGDDTNYFDGVIDEVRVYSRALTSSEIATLAK